GGGHPHTETEREQSSLRDDPVGGAPSPQHPRSPATLPGDRRAPRPARCGGYVMSPQPASVDKSSRVQSVEAAAQAAVDIAADITEGARQLAMELRENGRKMSEHLKEFAALANRVRPQCATQG